MVAGLPDLRAAARVQDGDDLDCLYLASVEDAVWEAVEECPAKAACDKGISIRVVSDPAKSIIECSAKIGSQFRANGVVPVARQGLCPLQPRE